MPGCCPTKSRVRASRMLRRSSTRDSLTPAGACRFSTFKPDSRLPPALAGVDHRTLAHDQRGILGAEESGAERGRVEAAVGRNAHEARQLGVAPLQLLGHERAQGRVVDRPLLRVAGAEVERRAAVVALLRAHRRG